MNQEPKGEFYSLVSPVVFAPVPHLFPLGCPVSIILVPNKAQSRHITSYFKKLKKEKKVIDLDPQQEKSRT